MSEIVELKALCFDLQKQNTELMNYLAAIAKLVDCTDINQIYPRVAELAALEQESLERKKRLEAVAEFIE